jgi:hypothetical protein
MLPFILQKRFVIGNGIPIRMFIGYRIRVNEMVLKGLFLFQFIRNETNRNRIHFVFVGSMHSRIDIQYFFLPHR